KNMLYRLSALGIKKGSEVCIKRKCLFNGPSIIEVNGQFLCIRQSDARNITLEE
ncbi:FeoA domain-containing protein, partial [Staphylococcus haemolyticus]